jgi:hypothetical protein
MQAITTKYLGPTNTQGARIKATCESGTVTVGYRHDLSGADVHAVAAMALARKLKFKNGGGWASGETKGGYVFVQYGNSWGDCYASSFQ